jgi:flagellar hook capping protein FlgD
VEFIPSRDEGSGGKRKSGGGTTLLALAAGPDCSFEELLSAIPVAKKDSLMTLFYKLMAGTVKNPAASVITLGSASPNPFNPATTISFSVQNETALALTVHDVRGRLVRTLASGRFPAGNHRVYWNGKDMRGRALASGVYFSRLVADGVAISRKLVLLK